MNYARRSIGTWLLADASFSLIVHMPDTNQTWVSDHWLRALRGILGLALVIMGAIG